MVDVGYGRVEGHLKGTNSAMNRHIRVNIVARNDAATVSYS